MASGRRCLLQRPDTASTACQRKVMRVTDFSHRRWPVSSSASLGMMA